MLKNLSLNKGFFCITLLIFTFYPTVCGKNITKVSINNISDKLQF